MLFFTKKGVIFVKKKKITNGVKTLLVVSIYLFLFLVSGLLAGMETGSLTEGFTIVLYGFYVFIYLLSGMKDGFPLTLKDSPDSTMWMYITVGFTIYILIIFISHYYLFQLREKKPILSVFLIVFVNLLIILSYSLFEAGILGAATV